MAYNIDELNKKTIEELETLCEKENVSLVIEDGKITGVKDNE